MIAKDIGVEDGVCFSAVVAEVHNRLEHEYMTIRAPIFASRFVVWDFWAPSGSLVTRNGV